MIGGRASPILCPLMVHESLSPSKRKVSTDKGPMISPRQIRAAEGPGKILAMRLGKAM